jgi:hypothetical protein
LRAVRVSTLLVVAAAVIAAASPPAALRPAGAVPPSLVSATSLAPASVASGMASGMVVTHYAAGKIREYRTAPPVESFGAALAGQVPTGLTGGGYGRDGLPAGRPGAGLPGTPPPSAQPGSPRYTLTVKGTNLSGLPDSGDLAVIANVNGHRFNATKNFDHGAAMFSVPSGTYWAVGLFYAGQDTRADILPQFSVHGATTIHLSERAADSQLTVKTPRPAKEVGSYFFVSRGAGFEVGAFTATKHGTTWVNPVSHRPSAGTMYFNTGVECVSPRGKGTRYAYTVNFPAPNGTIPPQHHAVGPANLATIHERFYSDVTAPAQWQSLGATPRQVKELGLASARSNPLSVPGRTTLYLSAAPAMVWQTSYWVGRFTGGQTSAFQLLHARQVLTENWDSYPLHPAPYVAGTNAFLAFPSAVRARNVLYLRVVPFSDNTPGHLGSGVAAGPGVKVTGRYELKQNAVKIASGAITGKRPYGGPIPVAAQANLSAKPSTVTFIVKISRTGTRYPLSTASRDMWTWPSRPEPNATVPAPWECGGTVLHHRVVLDRHCAVQDMLMLDYQVKGLSLTGTTAPGPQSLGITVSHLAEAAQSRVTCAQVRVSYDNGATWQVAKVTRTGPAQFNAAYTAPASVDVTLRVTTRDARGATLNETITRAYQITH